MLKDRYLLLKQQMNQITTNPLLDSILLDRLDQIEAGAPSDKYLAEKTRDLYKVSKRLQVGFSQIGLTPSLYMLRPATFWDCASMSIPREYLKRSIRQQILGLS